MADIKSDFTVPERVPMVILFAETRGFTRTSQILGAQEVLACTCEFFDLVSSAVERHEGGVTNVFNDTLIATFPGQGNATHAVLATQEIQRDFGVLSETWERDHDIRAAVSMGLHQGGVVVGLTSGGAKPGQLLVIGDSVSVAERLLHRARAGEIVLSKEVLDEYTAAGYELDAEELPPLRIPHREAIRIFGVVIDESRLDFT